MSLYLFLYLSVIIFSIYVWSIFIKKYNNASWYFFMSFNISLGIWFLLYFLSYFTTKDLSVLLFYIKFMYLFSILWIYSLLLFIYKFDLKNKSNLVKTKLFSINNLVLLFFWIILYYLYIYSPLIINHLEFVNNRNDYYESYWELFFIHTFLNFISLPLFIYITHRKYKKLNVINKIRLKYILFGAFLFLVLGIIFQLILPLYWIFLFEKDAVVFILPFLILTWYSITRYHFTDITYRYKQIYTFFLSITSTIFLFFLIKKFTMSLSENFIEYWELHKNFTYIDLVLWIIIFNWFYKIFYHILPWNSEYVNLIKVLNAWKEKIPFINNIIDLNKYLLKNANNKFGIKYINLKLLKENESDNEIHCFFTKNKHNNIFINDIVFIEENVRKFDVEKMKKSMNPKVFIIFPIFNNLNKLIWLLEIGRKPFNENFYTEEIKIIKDFVKFLVGHIKYMEIYAEINYLNLNLDKEVDRKTMEYNNLINKQKEFISMASHEIKTPVTASYMQIESIMDDVVTGEYNQWYLEEELNILKEQIYKVVDLVKNIFTVQQFEIKDIWLYIEKVKLKNLIIWEYDILQRLYPNIDFQIHVSDNIWFIEIDKIQFIQVISNLLNNSVKFLNKEIKIIKITANLLWDMVELVIEDNWPWFNYGDENIIFEKYSTGKWKSVWIWMGLYLCKKIVELHMWKIVAENSKELWWAKFKITIPKNYNK